MTDHSVAIELKHRANITCGNGDCMSSDHTLLPVSVSDFQRGQNVPSFQVWFGFVRLMTNHEPDKKR